MVEIAQPSDTRPSILICAWDPAETAWDPIEDLSGEPWNPPGARTVPIEGREDAEALAKILSTRLAESGCRALLLVGRTRRGNAFQLQLRAENRTADGARRLSGVGPGSARATAPAAEIVRALEDAGLSACASSEAEEDAGGVLLYSVLAALPDGVDSPAVALLRAPEAADDAAVRRAVKVAAEAMARHLSPLPRARAG